MTGSESTSAIADGDTTAFATNPNTAPHGTVRSGPCRNSRTLKRITSACRCPKAASALYRRDEGGQLEFTGENTIDHTPENETLRLYTGNAFDIVGERHRMNYRIDNDHNWIDESFQIKVRNHKKQPVTVRIIEHLYRCDNWDIRQSSDEFKKNDSHTVEFTVQIPPNEEHVLNYLVHYTW